MGRVKIHSAWLNGKVSNGIKLSPMAIMQAIEDVNNAPFLLSVDGEKVGECYVIDDEVFVETSVKIDIQSQFPALQIRVMNTDIATTEDIKDVRVVKRISGVDYVFIKDIDNDGSRFEVIEC